MTLLRRKTYMKDDQPPRVDERRFNLSKEALLVRLEKLGHKYRLLSELKLFGMIETRNEYNQRVVIEVEKWK